MATIEIGAYASPFAVPEVWDQIQVAGQFWPPPSSGHTSARIKISGAKRAYKWDVKDGQGLQGAYETYKGLTLPTFTITFFIWTNELYAAWDTFQTYFQYRPVTDPKQLSQVNPVSIYHPQLANLGIYEVITDDIGQVEMVDEAARMFAVTVTLREFRKPLPIVASTADASSNGDPANPAEDPRIVRATQELAVVNAQLAQTGLLGTNPQSITPPPPPFKGP